MRKFLLLPICLLSSLLLCGCQENVELSSGQFPADSAELSIVLQDGETQLLSSFAELKSVDFSGSNCYEEIIQWAQANPQIACTYTVDLPNGTTVANDVSALDLSGLESVQLKEAMELMRYLPNVSEVELGSGSKLSAEDINSFAASFPEVKFDFEFSFLGKNYSVHETEAEFDLSSASRDDVEQLLPWLVCLKDVKAFKLGDENSSQLTWDDISAIHSACPDAELDYSFTLYGKSFTLADSSMELRHIPIDDEGALVKQITVCMPNLSYLDMDSCGVSDEAMAEIRDALPNTNVVWRVWFGDGYCVRTDVERILASNPGRGGELTAENTVSLKYCTKVKYLDLGHNNYLSDISFVSHMPDLEVLVVAMGNWSDSRPLADCPKLEYLELQSSSLNDLRPLAGLENLKHLNICYCLALHDLSPIMDLDLDRLWIGCLTPISPEQVDEYQKLHPECKINTTTLDPTEENWRYFGHNEFGVMQLDPRYELLRDQMHYDLGMDAYAYIGNDPYYYG